MLLWFKRASKAFKQWTIKKNLYIYIGPTTTGKCHVYFCACLRGTPKQSFALLLFEVLGRANAQIKQFRKGIKESGIWPLLTARADVVSLLFPRETDIELTPQVSRITRIKNIIKLHVTWSNTGFCHLIDDPSVHSLARDNI